MDYGPWITATSAVLVAIITGVITIIQARKKQSTEVQQSIHNGFQLLINTMQAERVTMTEKIELQAEENVELRKEVGLLQRTVMSLENKIDRMLRQWRAGDAPPSEGESRSNRDDHLPHQTD